MDHIVPRNQGGSDDFSNLQSLCFRCNAAKRWEAGCVFCGLEGSGRVLLENELALCIADAYPVTPGHSLVIPRRHCGGWVGVAPTGMECGGGAGSFDTRVLRSAGGNLMPSNDNVGLDLKHPINHVRITALLDQLQG